MWRQSICSSQDRQVQTFNKLMQTHNEFHKKHQVLEVVSSSKPVRGRGEDAEDGGVEFISCPGGSNKNGFHEECSRYW
jgi:hypothetical protein